MTSNAASVLQWLFGFFWDGLSSFRLPYLDDISYGSWLMGLALIYLSTRLLRAFFGFGGGGLGYGRGDTAHNYSRLGRGGDNHD